ncbi:patatin-domain-containing protein [Morchella conica CCBAS932]|uniref:Patatin-like phospholipase domain-containing protein n=1 Tax=Morchella conica CCBAS932 TaxID=1392247 RepID=A0A3N4KW90_9PEZI|nr:patatin-domain-containing protein [Morchella conica CCBAS932]
MSYFPASSATPYNHRRSLDAAATATPAGQDHASTSNRSESTLAPLFRFIKDPTSALTSVFASDEATRRHQLASARLKNAINFADWEKAAKELDHLEGSEGWKSDPSSPDYDSDLISARLKQLDDARLSCDIRRMMFLIRTTLSRNLGEMGNIRLYKYSHTGTKRLIEKYIDSCLATLDTLISLPVTADTPSSSEILESLINTRQAFGRTALLLSGGATFGMNHIGVMKALWDVDLLPRIISGASAGSIVAAVLCTRTDDEIPNILEEFPFGNLDVFEDGKNPETILSRLARFLKIGAWIDSSHLTRVMRELIGDITFQEAYNRTRRILNICVTSASVYELPRLLNYVSAPNVLVWSAVAASCSVPFLFSAMSLLSKDPKTGLPVPWSPTPQRWIDGSVENDLPMTRLAEMFNVNHFIVSQVNPHVVPFLPKEFILSPDHAPAPPESSTTGWGETVVKLAVGEVLHRMNMLAEIGIFKTSLTKARSVLSQKYSGDITILPEVSYADFPKMLKNPTAEFMFQATLRGERATWPKMSRIRNHCAIELALDTAIHKIRTRVVFSPSQVDLRMGNLRGISGDDRGLGVSGASTATTNGALTPFVVVGGRGRKRGMRRRMHSHDPSTHPLRDRSLSRRLRSGAMSPVHTRSEIRPNNIFFTPSNIPSKELDPEDVENVKDVEIDINISTATSSEDSLGDSEPETEIVKTSSILSADGTYEWSLVDPDSESEGAHDEDGLQHVHMANTPRRRRKSHPRRPSVPSVAPSTNPTSAPSTPGGTVPSATLRRWEMVFGRMTPATGDDGAQAVKVGLGRAKSAGELKGLLG